jgi:hypothetical protein
MRALRDLVDDSPSVKEVTADIVNGAHEVLLSGGGSRVDCQLHVTVIAIHPTVHW